MQKTYEENYKRGSTSNARPLEKGGIWMNFLKIATSKDVRLTGIESVNLSEQLNPAELAAIVIKKEEKNSQQLAQNLREKSGLEIPIIEVDNNVDSEQVLEIAKKYEQKMVPGFLQDLVNFAQDRPISFTTPGHHNGQYYMKHPAGVVFDKFFGENLMFADTSDTVPELGDTMTHEGHR